MGWLQNCAGDAGRGYIEAENQVRDVLPDLIPVDPGNDIPQEIEDMDKCVPI